VIEAYRSAEKAAGDYVTVHSDAKRIYIPRQHPSHGADEDSGKVIGDIKA